MPNRLMITVAAAALIAGSGFANAQGNMGRESPAGGAGVQQSTPSSPSGGATSREGSEGIKSGQSEEKGAIRDQRARDTRPGATESSKSDKSRSMGSQDERGGTARDMKAEDHERSGNMKAEGREGRDNNMKAEGREGRDSNVNAEGRGNNTNMGANSAAEGRSQTTGQAGAGAKLSTEQRTRITSIVRDQHVAPVNNVNFAVAVGTRVPRDIGFHPLPADIATIYPEWRGYEFFLVRDQIVVVDPRTLEIVAVLGA